MASVWNRLRGRQRYDRLEDVEKEPVTPTKTHSTARSSIQNGLLAVVAVALIFGLYGLARVITLHISNKSCDSVDDGYRCSPEISHFWGQYSLWFSVPSEVDASAPKDCDVTFASVLSRHGGRDPTLGKSMLYNALIASIQNTSTSYPGEFAFLKDYKYTLGADQLTDAGRQEMVNSGAHFYRRYSKLVVKKKPFVRSAGQDRVVESANKWLQGFAEESGQSLLSIDVTIPEGDDFNNTLSHETCDAYSSKIGDDAQNTWIAKFIPPIQSRVNSKLGVNITDVQTTYLMDMCSFDTLASPTASISPFCGLFTEDEWHQYDYLQTLGKWYGHGTGNPLGATQGAGWVNELIARLTETPVQDSTNTNKTLDADSKTFPLDSKVYADFSHDNDMSRIFAALGLYNNTKPLSNTTLQGTNETNSYSAAWTVPFAARMYVEKLKCSNEDEEYVRIIMNDRVMPLEFCNGHDGRCRLSHFVHSQLFSRSGGHWDQCSVNT